MPTGYTAPVVDGEVTEFKDFAMRCARGMGALILFRDHSLDYIPTVDDLRNASRDRYHVERLNEAKSKLEEFEAASEDELIAEWKAVWHERDVQYERERWKKFKQQRAIESMMQEVEVWEPPTEEHASFKEFMLDQLKQTLEYDGRLPERKFYRTPAFEEWKSIRKESLERDVRYHTEQHEREVENSEYRVNWYSALLDSLE